MSGASSSPSSSPVVVPSPLEELAQLRQQVMQLSQYAAQQRQQQQQQQAAAAAAQAQALQPRVEMPKIRQPSTFTGAMGFAVDDWISEMQQQFAYYGAQFPDDASRVRFAVAFLGGSALHWWEHEPGRQLVVTWSAFVDRLHARFRPVQAAMIARQRLGRFRQNERHTVNQYVSAFQTVLTPIVDMSDADQVHHFVNGLLPSIAAKVWEKHPKTLVEAIEHAVTAEATGNFGRAAMPFASRSFVSHHGTGASSSTSAPMDINHVGLESFFGEQSESHSVSMLDPASAAVMAKMEAFELELNAMFGRGNQPSGKKKSNNSGRSEEIQRLMSEGRCFSCKEKGHMKSECPKSKSKNE